MTWVYDDGGRAAAGFRGETRDCVTRAIAIATGGVYRPYREVYDALNALAHEMGVESSARTGVRREVYDAYLRSLGWGWTPTMRVGAGCRVHLLAGELPPGRVVVRLSRHLAAVIDGVVYDTHDPSRGGRRCVYGYWRLPERGADVMKGSVVQ